MPPKKKFRRDKSRQEWRKQRSHRGGKKDGHSREDGAGYTLIVRENALLEKYYKEQGFIPEDEWEEFISIMKEDLPATFRITGTRGMAEHVKRCLEMKFFRDLSALEVEGERVPPPQPLPWYPNNLAWHVSLTRKFIRKSSLVSKFHSFLVKENEQGNISRQEAVSMIPPLLLDVRPQHKVLDMCAAPGSKTAQLIEFLHAEDTTANAIPSGVIVANDADNKRCYMLVHQAKRLNSPSFMVTNHDASVFPMLYYHDEDDVRHPLYYDRVLCDVPCSGDGTLRKNPMIWKNWNPAMGPALHKLQLRILHRGLELLAPGGRLVYSTCSLNPVEDEAVIATALATCKGTVEIIDCSERLPGLRRQSGLSSWKVMTKEGEWIASATEIPKTSSNQIKATMFSPSEDGNTFHLERCMRVLPHYQNSGGFFIAVLEKKDWLPWQRKQRKTRKPEVTSESTKEVTTTIIESTDKEESDKIEVVPNLEELASKALTEKAPPTPVEQPQDTGTGDVAPANRSDSDDDGRVVRTNTGSASVATSGASVGGAGVVAEEKLEPEDERPPDAVLGKPGFRQQRGRGFKEDPYVFLDKDSDVYKTVQPYFGLSESFPSSQLLVRTYTGKKRNIYLASKLVKELTKRNEHLLKTINIGVKVMARCDHVKTSCDFRLSQEGVDTVVPFVSAHQVQVTQEDLRIILSEANPLTTSLSQLAQTSVKEKCSSMGPVVFTYTPVDQTKDDSTDESFTLNCPIHLSGWVAAKSVRLYVDKNYRYHYLSILGYDPPENQSLETISAKIRTGEDEGDFSSDDEAISEKVQSKDEQSTDDIMESTPSSVHVPQRDDSVVSENQVAPTED